MRWSSSIGSCSSQAVKANTKAVDLATQLYKQGLTDFLNVIVAEQSLLSSQDALAQSNLAIATDLISLYNALGGGWEPFRTIADC